MGGTQSQQSDSDRERFQRDREDFRKDRENFRKDREGFTQDREEFARERNRFRNQWSTEGSEREREKRWEQALRAARAGEQQKGGVTVPSQAWDPS